MIWLLRKLHPDHKTIADFRKDNIAPLKQVCREFTLLCHKLKLFGGELIAIDGSTFSAVNHNSRSFTKKKLLQLIRAIDAKIATYLNNLDEQDQVETKIPGVTANNVQEKIAQLRDHKAEVEKLQTELEASGEAQIALTDSDSRLMPKSKSSVEIIFRLNRQIHFHTGWCFQNDNSKKNATNNSSEGLKTSPR